MTCFTPHYPKILSIQCNIENISYIIMKYRRYFNRRACLSVCLRSVLQQTKKSVSWLFYTPVLSTMCRIWLQYINNIFKFKRRQSELPILPFDSSSKISRLGRVPQLYWCYRLPPEATAMRLYQLPCLRW